MGECDESLSVGFDGCLGVLEDACAGRESSLGENRHILHISQVLAEGRQRVYWLFRRNGTNATAREGSSAMMRLETYAIGFWVVT